MPRNAYSMTTQFVRVVAGFLLLATGGCNSIPWLEQAVRLPDGKTVARVMIRAGGEYRTVVENEFGSASHSQLNPVDHGHREANLYLTPENWLVVIDISGVDAIFDVASGRRPSEITYVRNLRSRTDSRKWRYLGQVSRGGGNSLQYATPSKKAECIALYGEGASPFRREYQAKSHCPSNNTDRIRLQFELHQALAARHLAN